MKKVILIILTVITVSILALSLAACSSNVSTDKLLRLNWCSDDFTETFTYSVSGKVDGNLVTGSLVLTIKPADGGYVVEREQVMDDGTVITGSVKFSKSGSFLPSESVRIDNKNGTKTVQKTVYDGKKVSCYRADGDVIPEGTSATEYEIASPYYDNLQFYTIIRGATYDKKFNLSFNTFAPAENKVVKLQCSLGSTENKSYVVNSEAGSVDCQVVYVALTSAPVSTNQSFKAYYAKSDIRLDSGYALKQTLVEFTESSFTYTLTDASATKA